MCLRCIPSKLELDKGSNKAKSKTDKKRKPEAGIRDEKSGVQPEEKLSKQPICHNEQFLTLQTRLWVIPGLRLKCLISGYSHSAYVFSGFHKIAKEQAAKMSIVRSPEMCPTGRDLA